MIICKRCGKNILSDKPIRCPHCGEELTLDGSSYYQDYIEEHYNKKGSTS